MQRHIFDSLEGLGECVLCVYRERRTGNYFMIDEAMMTVQKCPIEKSNEKEMIIIIVNIECGIGQQRSGPASQQRRHHNQCSTVTAVDSLRVWALLCVLCAVCVPLFIWHKIHIISISSD